MRKLKFSRPAKKMLVAFLLVCSMVVSGLLLAKHFSPDARIAHFPAVPLFRTVLSVLKKLPFDDALRYTTQMDLIHKCKVVRAYFQGQWTLVIGCPKLAQQIYCDTETFPKLVPKEDLPKSVFAKLTGHSAFFTNAQTWRKHRKTLLDPAALTSYVSNKTTLSSDSLSSLMANMNAKSNSQKGTCIDALDLMQRVTFDCLSQQFLNRNFNLTESKDDKLANSMLIIFDNAFTYGFTLMTILFPSLQTSCNPYYKKVYEDIQKWEDCLTQIIKATRKTIEIEGVPTKPMDLVTKMILASNQSQISIEESNEAILNNLKMLFLPSQSLPPALCAALHFIAQDSAIQSNILAEVKSNIGESVNGFALNQSQLNTMPYLGAVVKETLRLYPTLCPPPKRVVTKDVTIGEHFIPKGTHLMIDMFSIQHDPSLWSNPAKFDPTRFLNEANGMDATKSTIQSGYLPFAAGSRRCPGSQLVQDLMMNTLANIVANYEVRYPAKQFSTEVLPTTHRIKLKLKAQVILIPDTLHLIFIPRYYR
ncbi:hypothetical protein L0F63_002313 [Massospora cicadina]|nr:hypothetical protein L0F63_002313 [Massospora cicadina]